jgi:3-deoxy-D-manno-octulosonic-acid transferase
MSPTSAGRYRKLGWLLRPLLLARVARFGMQSDGYANALRDLGVVSDRVQVTGSVKYDGALSDRHNPRVEKLRRTLGLDANDRVFVAGSTHAPEEQIVLDLFRRLRVAHSELRLILAPRSADRFEEVARLIEKNAFPFARRSQITGELPGKPPVILLDTIGELNAAWGLADVGFTGGSLDGRRGGQSMIEPAGLGVPVVFGPHVWNFRDAAARLLEADAAIKIDGPISMKQELQALLDDDARRARMGDAARRMVIAQQGATEKTIDLIDDVLRLTSKESLRVAA